MPADENSRREASRLARPPRARARQTRSLALALAACSLLLVAVAVASLGAPGHAQGRGLIPNLDSASPTATATATATSTPTATPTAGTISLVSPSYGSGPVGAHVTVSGAGFGGGSVTLKAASHPDCSSSQATLTSATLAGGSFTQTFVWPSSLPNGTYYICADGTTSGPAYQQLATSAPAISLSAPSAAQESQLVISGSNFVGLSAGSNIQLTAEQGNARANLPSGVVDANGQFTVPWTVDLSLTGTVVISAQSPPEGTSPPVLQATASVNVTPPATATPSATASVSPTASAGGGGTSTSNGSGGGGALLVLLIVLLLVALLVGGGAVAFVLMRRRGTGGPQTPYPPGGGRYPGYSSSPYGTSSPDWDAPTQGMGSAWPSGQYGGGGGDMGTGGYGAAGGYGGYSGSGVGAVSQWDDQPTGEYGDEPSAGWQPRPMTGYGDFTLPPEARPGDDGSGGYAPADPWGNAGGSGSSAGGGYGGYGGYGSQDDGGWRNQQAGDPGTTRPGGGAGATQQRYPRQPQQGQGQGQGQGQSQGYGQDYGQQGYGAGWPDEPPAGGAPPPPPDDWRQ